MLKNWTKRFLAAFLVIGLVFTVIPLPALAADGDSPQAASSNSSEATALTALGIDTSKVPGGYVEDAENPYGRDVSVLNPVAELYTVGLKEDPLKYTDPTSALTAEEKQNTETTKTVTKKENQQIQNNLYGDSTVYSNVADILNNPKQMAPIASGTSDIATHYNRFTISNAKPAQRNGVETTSALTGGGETIGFALSTVAEGNFDGNSTGKTAQAVVVYTSKLDKNGGLYMKIGDITNGSYGASRELISTSVDIGNPDAKLDGSDVPIENFALSPYLMQNYLKAATGDFDNDGMDEIAVYIPAYGASRIEVYKFQKKTGQPSDAYKTPANWELEWTYSFRETAYVSNMVSLTVGDVNADGADDIAATWGYYYGPFLNGESRAVVMFGAKQKMLEKSHAFPLEYKDANGTLISKIVRGAFAFGDLLGSGSNMLVLGGQLENDLRNDNVSSRYAAAYQYYEKKLTETSTETGFNITLQQNFDLFEKKDGKYVYGIMEGRGNVFYSSPGCVSNLAIIKQGLLKPAILYFDSLNISCGEDGFALKAALDNTDQIQRGSARNYYVEYGGKTADMVGNGYDTFVGLQQFLGTSTEVVESITVTEPRTVWRWVSHVYYSNWFCKLFGIKSYRYAWEMVTVTTSEQVTETLTQNTTGKTYMNFLDSEKNTITGKEVNYSVSACFPNTDNDTTFLVYKNNGGHYFMYSDPQVLAVIASPPYFKDLLDRSDLSGNYNESATSYTHSIGSGDGGNVTATIKAGVYVKVEQEFSVFGVKVAQAEAEVAITAGFTYSYETSKELVQSIEYSTTSGQDSVVFYSLPIEVFEYTAYIPDGAGNYKAQAMTVNIPHEAANSIIPLDKYEMIAADFDILPNIASSVLTHTLGDPATYPTSTAGKKVIAEYKGTPETVGFTDAPGGTYTTQALDISTSKSHSFSASVAIETKAGAGAGGVTVGVTVGAEVGGGYVTTSTAGSTYTGQLQYMPKEAEDFGYHYNWRLFCYEYNDGKIRFPVVNYIVSDVQAPAALPTDFSQNVEKTSDKSIALDWSYDKVVAGFVIYRYYDFPIRGGVSEIATVPFTAGVYNSATGKYHFEFVEQNLSPYTDYTYQIQTIRAALPKNSIYSETLIARTKPGVGQPVLTIEGLDKNGQIPIFPDSSSTVRVLVNNAQGQQFDYKVNAYYWEKRVGSNWSVIGRDSSYTFANSGSADQAEYRCLVNMSFYDDVSKRDFYVSAYTDVFSTVYSKRIPMEVENSFKANVSGNRVDMEIGLMTTHTGHLSYPTGQIMFTVTGANYIKSLYGTLSNGPMASGNIPTARAAVSLPDLEDGIYEITAQYLGGQIFRSLTAGETLTILVGNKSGYQLTLNKKTGGTLENTTNFIYGDFVQPVLRNVSLEGGKTVIKDVDPALAVYKVTDAQGNAAAFVKDVTELEIGTKTLVAYIYGNETEAVAERNFEVRQRPITIALESGHSFESANNSGLEAAVLSAIKITKGDLAFKDKASELKLTFTAQNTAGNVVNVSGMLPGNYTITPIPGYKQVPAEAAPEYKDYLDYMEYIKNYDITIEPGQFTVTSKRYQVEYSPGQLGNTVGYISLSSANTDGANYSASTPLLFLAHPNIGYEVLSWQVYVRNPDGDFEKPVSEGEGGTQSKGNRFTYSMLSEDIKVVAVFVRSETTLTINKVGQGVVTNDSFVQSGKVVSPGAKIRFTAKPAVGYHFGKWTVAIGEKTTDYTGTYNDDGTFSYDFEMGQVPTTLYVEFIRDSYRLSIADNLEAYYYTGVGSNRHKVAVPNGDKVMGDTEITVCAKTGFAVPADAEWLINGQPFEAGSVSADSQKATFAIKEDSDVFVETENVKYTVSAEANDQDMGSVKLMVNNHQIASPAANVDGGSRIDVQASPSYGYVFDSWSLNGELVSRDLTYAIANLGEDAEIVANFSPAQKHRISVAFDLVKQPVYCSVTDKYGNVEAVDQLYADSFMVNDGDALTVTVEPDVHLMIRKWSINQEDLANPVSAPKSYINGSVTENLDIIIYVVAKANFNVRYGIDPNSANGGSIGAAWDGVPFNSPDSGVGGGSKVEFTAAPPENYMVSGWRIGVPDGGSGQYAYEDVTIGGNPFVGETMTVDGLASDIDVIVFFKEKVVHTITFDFGQDVAEKFEITVTIDPNTEQSKNIARDGAALIITAIPKGPLYTLSLSVDNAETNGVGADNFILEDNTITVSSGEGFNSITALPTGGFEAAVNAVRSDLTVTASAAQAVLSSDSTLSSLSASGVTLPTFDPQITYYSANVENSVSGTTISAAANYSKATVSGAGYKDLSVGPNSFNITVTAQDGSMKIYTVSITRSGGGIVGGGGGGGAVTYIVTEKYVDMNGETISPATTVSVPAGGTFKQDIPLFEGYVLAEYRLADGTAGKSSSVSIKGVASSFTITYVYDKAGTPIGGDGVYMMNFMSVDAGLVNGAPYYVNDNGKKVFAAVSYIRDGKAYFMGAPGKEYKVSQNDKRFDDIAGHWAIDSINYNTSREIFLGTSSTNFSPNAPLTRAMVVTVLARIAGVNLEAYSTSSFTDVDIGRDWFAKSAEWAYEKGITSGTGYGRFDPYKQITREELAVMFYRFSKYAGFDLPKSETKEFIDAGSISGYAVEAVEFMRTTGLMQGNPSGAFLPKAALVRAEFAAVIERMSKIILDGLYKAAQEQ